MTRRSQKEYRISMTVSEENMRVIFDLLKGEAHDFAMKEVVEGQINSQPVQTRTTTRTYERGALSQSPQAAAIREARKWSPTQEQRENWAMRHWHIFRNQMLKHDGGIMRYDDPDLIEALKANGSNPNILSPLWTTFLRAGKVERIAKGTYRLIEETQQ